MRPILSKTSIWINIAQMFYPCNPFLVSEKSRECLVSAGLGEAVKAPLGR
jgi:hypothetical protein